MDTKYQNCAAARVDIEAGVVAGLDWWGAATKIRQGIAFCVGTLGDTPASQQWLTGFSQLRNSST